ncbi:MAG: right-handed parallel beta-helix repeat-containing protein [Lentisphaeria bacterium]|nr:right-handed parallel beta-helix repeat-containing protein [Lentisphaeria bacterium]
MLKALFIVCSGAVCAALCASELTLYAAPEARGKGSGSSPENAARLWDHKLWKNIKKKLEKSPVTLQLAPGNYYTELPAKKETSLVLRGVGNEKHHFTLRGAENHGSVFARHPNDSKEIKNNLFPLIIIRNNSRNIIIDGLRFTGNGLCSAALAVSRSRDILIRNCVWKDLRGAFYAASSADAESENITWENCLFENVGYDTRAHMLYNSNSSKKLTVRNCTMIDAYGDFVRFRNKVDDVTVENCTFIDNGKYDSSPMLAFPIFVTEQVVKKGGEFFSTGLTVRNNRFEFKKKAERNWMMCFHISGYNPPGREYLMSQKDIAAFNAMDRAAQRKFLDERMGLQTDRIRFENNTIINAEDTVVYECWPKYGSEKNFPPEEYNTKFSLGKALLEQEK